jgi:hypothetical protein
MKRFTIFLVVSMIALLGVAGSAFAAVAAPNYGQGGIPSDVTWITPSSLGIIINSDVVTLDKLEKDLGTSDVEAISAYFAGKTWVASPAPAASSNMLDKIEKDLGTSDVEAISAYFAGMYGSGH